MMWSYKVNWQFKDVNIHFHKTFGYQTLQGCDLLSEIPTHKAIKLFWTHDYIWALGKIKTDNPQILFSYDYL